MSTVDRQLVQAKRGMGEDAVVNKCDATAPSLPAPPVTALPESMLIV